MARILGSLLGLLIALLIIVLLSTSFLISSDLIRGDLYEKYRNDKSFLYTLDTGATVHIRDEGNRNGPPLILLHGAYGSVHAWEPWVQALGDDYRLISFDLPGFGLTGAVPNADYSRAGMSQTVSDIIKLMKLKKVVMVGHSMGGGVALHYALDNPGKVRGLVLVSASGMRRSIAEAPPSSFELADITWLQPVMRYVTPRFMFASALRDTVADPDNFVTDEMIDRYWELIRMTGSRAAIFERRNARQSNAPLDERLSELTMPALLIWGAQDKIVPLSQGVRMNGAIFNSRLVAYPELGHLPMEEAPAKTAADVRSFLQTMLP
ncbi:MAG TPA: hypothetical protein DIT66_00895 [Rhodobiaceae bacterium]|nr:MAG: 2-hydroxy-6-oxo-6-phenylhexa-2,4-dienoate hydrolase [Rhodobiaceae bacterium UBA7378]HCQ81352.1 hypothetical protein [Rhodobiaceae bacterium]